MRVVDERSDEERNDDAEKGLFEKYGRMSKANLLDALGPLEERGDVLCYVCGPRGLTDWAVNELRSAEGVEQAKVLCEKWW